MSSVTIFCKNLKDNITGYFKKNNARFSMIEIKSEILLML